MKLRIKKLRDNAVVPRYAHEGDAGLDLYSTVDAVIMPGQRTLIPTGIAIELPPQTEAQIRPRSGLALKNGITVINSPGTIDAGYRGEIGIVLINHGSEPFSVTVGSKIAQMVINRFETAEIEEADELSDSERGTGGYGSTGV